jgi:hypothetical protein
MHEGPAAFRFELAGDLDAADAATLEQDWQTASPSMRNRTLIIDLSFVTGVDEAVRSLFRRWYAGGAEFAAGSKWSRELVESITGRPFIAGVAACADVSALVLVEIDGARRLCWSKGGMTFETRPQHNFKVELVPNAWRARFARSG